jgi:alginate O-acetyltransferase complex protein AlgI
VLFNSWPFVALVAIVFPLYYWKPVRRLQVHVLLAASLTFYGYHEPKLLLLLMFSIAINAISSYWVTFGRPSRRLWWAVLGVGMNLAVLLFFKYSGLLYRTLLRPDPTDRLGEFILSIPLPIGISFFTFQGISLVIDTYRNRDSATPSFELERGFGAHLLRISFFKSFFPQLVAGPIVKAHEFLPQIAPKTIAGIERYTVARNLIGGYFLKMVVADHLKDVTQWLAYPAFLNWSSSTLLSLLFGYSMQIFADFAGYSLIALGLAGLFGYRLPINFNYPYIAESFAEFWQRWHISLSSFLRQYLYIPLGGNRGGPLRTYRNLMIVMFLGGLWHGAAWSYAIWGSVHGLALVVERVATGHRPPRARATWLRVSKALLVFGFVTCAWLLFKLPNFDDVLEFVRAVATQWSVAPNYLLMFNVALYSAPIVLMYAYHLWRRSRGELDARAETVVLGILLSMIILESGSPGAFIYFQF